MKIRDFIRSMFPATGAVPAELDVDTAEQLLAEAKVEERSAGEDLADKAEQLDAALAAAAMNPNDVKVERAVAAADAAHREAQLRYGKGQALVRGVTEKLSAARAKQAAQDDAEYAAQVRADAKELVDTCFAIDAAVDMIVIHLQAALAMQGPLTGVGRDVHHALFSADQVIKTIVARMESRISGRGPLLHVGMLGRNVAATAVGSLPRAPIAEPPIADPVSDDEAAA